ncbi:MAG TPA: transaminase [Candidatus Nanopelagicales bacterium]|jgi:glutamate-1-semialdehyde aminotransferase
MSATYDPDNLARLQAEEQERFVRTHPRSAELFERSERSMPGGVPMLWMVKWPGSFPVYVAEAGGSHFRDVDGHDYVDFCLGDTGAMTGHSPAATVAALKAQLDRGITSMLPTEDAPLVAEELARRFGLPLWQFTLTATDANRHALRYARHVTGRSKVVVHEWCYHGSVDETFAVLDANGETVARPGNIGAPVPLSETTRVVPYNDVEALERALAHGDVAAVLMEPALTNVGIVLPEPGYLDACRELTTRYGALWIVDETHCISVGPGGWTGTYGLTPDMLTMGKPIGGGIPCGTFGMTEDVAARIAATAVLEDIDVGGIGGTLAGNALSLAAMRVTLTEVFTDAAFEVMRPLGTAWADGVDAVIAAHGAPWNCSRLGARAEYNFAPVAPRNGAQAHAAGDFALEQYLHLHALNRGILLTPFHNMALMAPTTTTSDIDHHTNAFEEAVASIYG